MAYGFHSLVVRNLQLKKGNNTVWVRGVGSRLSGWAIVQPVLRKPKQSIENILVIILRFLICSLLTEIVNDSYTRDLVRILELRVLKKLQMCLAPLDVMVTKFYQNYGC